MFRDEMSAQARPSLDGMAQEVLAKGRRASRARTAKIAHRSRGGRSRGRRSRVPRSPAAATGGGKWGAVVKSGGPTRPGTLTPPRRRARSPAAAILTTVTSPAPYIPQPGPKAPTDSAAVLDELLKFCRRGSRAITPTTVSVRRPILDGASGLGMIRLSLFKGSLNPDACTTAVPSDMTGTCSTLPSGANVLTTRISDNCIEPLVIDVDHGDGTVAEIDVATCLVWNGHSNPPTHMAITAAQALQIAANPAWGAVQMDAALVHEAASRFADLPGNTHSGGRSPRRQGTATSAGRRGPSTSGIGEAHRRRACPLGAGPGPRTR